MPKHIGANARTLLLAVGVGTTLLVGVLMSTYWSGCIVDNHLKHNLNDCNVEESLIALIMFLVVISTATRRRLWLDLCLSA
jgi:hypothetical protein